MHSDFSLNNNNILLLDITSTYHFYTVYSVGSILRITSIRSIVRIASIRSKGIRSILRILYDRYYTVSDSCFCFSVFFSSGRKFDRCKDTFVRGEDVFGRRKDTSKN